MKEILSRSGIFSLADSAATQHSSQIQQRLAAIFQATTDFVFTIDFDGQALYINRAGMKMLGIESSNLTGLCIQNFYPEKALQSLLNEAIPIAIREGVCHQESELIGIAGRVPVSQVVLAHKTTEKVEFLSIIARDISELKNAEKASQLFARVFETTQEGIIITDANKNMEKVNAAFSTVTGYSSEEVIGKNPRILQSGRQDGEFYKNLWEKVDRDGQWQGEIWNRRKNGEIYPEWLTISTIKDEAGTITNYVGIFSDISTIKSSESYFAHLAYHDGLTKLPNRALFKDRLNLAITKAARNGGMVAVFFLDLDRFKPVNDKFGHPIGDQLLQAVAQRLINCVREADTVARMGGDEFTIILDNIPNMQSAAMVAQKVLDSISQPFILDGHELSIGISIGISLYPLNAKDAPTLISNADAAMYYSKQAGKNTYRFY